jgi:hypothetical protein
MGIDRTIFENVSEHLICPVCLDVLDDPATGLCGHTCCYSCWFMIASVEHTSPVEISCPLCRQKYDIPDAQTHSSFIWSTNGKLFVRARIIKDIIGDLVTKCHWSGCKVKEKYSDRAKHLENCLRSNQLRPIRYLPRQEFRELLANELEQNASSRRIYWCDRCDAGFDDRRILQLHVNDVHEDFILHWD